MGPRLILPPVYPSSANYTTPGTYTLVVPNFNSFVIDVRGGGGGGGGAGSLTPRSDGTAGTAGTYSLVTIPGWGSVVGYPGGGGTPSTYNGNFGWNDGAAGAHGTATDGDSNITGGGSAGGTGANIHGGYNPEPRSVGGNGGYGGRAVRTFTRQGRIVQAKQTLTIVVGSGGSPGSIGTTTPAVYAYPQPGGVGAVYISWS